MSFNWSKLSLLSPLILLLCIIVETFSKFSTVLHQSEGASCLLFPTNHTFSWVTLKDGFRFSVEFTSTSELTSLFSLQTCVSLISRQTCWSSASSVMYVVCPGVEVLAGSVREKAGVERWRAEIGGESGSAGVYTSPVKEVFINRDVYMVTRAEGICQFNSTCLSSVKLSPGLEAINDLQQRLIMTWTNDCTIDALWVIQTGYSDLTQSHLMNNSLWNESFGCIYASSCHCMKRAAFLRFGLLGYVYNTI